MVLLQFFFSSVSPSRLCNSSFSWLWQEGVSWILSISGTSWSSFMLFTFLFKELPCWMEEPVTQRCCLHYENQESTSSWAMYQVAKSWCPTDTTDEFSMFLRFIGTELWYAYMCLFSLYFILCLWNLATVFQKHSYFYYGVHYCMYYNLFTLWMYLDRMEFFFFTKNKKIKHGAASVSLVPKN